MAYILHIHREGGCSSKIAAESRQWLRPPVSCLSFDTAAWHVWKKSHLHELGVEPMDQGAEGQAATPRGRQVGHRHIPVALCLLLAPCQQSTRSNLRLWTTTQRYHVSTQQHRQQCRHSTNWKHSQKCVRRLYEPMTKDGMSIYVFGPFYKRQCFDVVDHIM